MALVKGLMRRRRIELGLTMKEVAEAIGVSEATVSRWESGNIANMRRSRIVALANVLQISPLDLLDELPSESRKEALPKTNTCTVPKTTEKRVERFVHEIMSTEPENFKRRLLITLSQLNESEWHTLEQIVCKIESSNL